jgi:class 3 adenylate cyclase
VAIQRALAEHRRTHGFAPSVRIGLHAGDATRTGDDYVGLGVNIASRIADLADGGRIVASAGTMSGTSAFTRSAPRSIPIKGVAEPVEIVEIEWT